MGFEDFQEALRPKVQGTLNLHEAFMNTSLDFFLMLSSCVGIIGNSGQANYGSACTFQDAFARYRTSLGMPARSLDLGMISGAGYVHENESVFKYLTAQGFQAVTIEELLHAMEYAITEPVTSCNDSQLILGLTGSPDQENQAMNFADAKFEHIRSSWMRSNYKVGSLRSRIKDPQHGGDPFDLVREAIIAQISKILVISVEEINSEQSLSTHGLDSLSAVELRSWLARELDATFGVMEILSGGKSVDGLSRDVIIKSGLL